MLMSPQNLPARIAAVQERVARAAGAAGRSAQSVTLLAIGKAQPVPLLGAAAACGLEHFGESYLQEALAKIAALRERGLTWHFVGPVQANKTRPIRGDRAGAPTRLVRAASPAPRSAQRRGRAARHAVDGHERRLRGRDRRGRDDRAPRNRAVRTPPSLGASGHLFAGEGRAFRRRICRHRWVGPAKAPSRAIFSPAKVTPFAGVFAVTDGLARRKRRRRF